MFQGKKLICFDLDGTLIDSVGIWNQVDADLIQQLSKQTIDLQMIQQQRDAQLKKFRHCADPYLEYCGFIQDFYGSTLSKQQIKTQRYAISEHYLDNIITLKPQAELFLQQLKLQGFELALTTTTSLHNMQRYTRNNANIYQKIDFDALFSLILTRENVQNIKPHPEVYLSALQYFGLQPEECLIIEDSLLGVEAAKHAGIEVIAIYDHYSQHEQDQIQQQADAFVQDYAELLSFIR